MAIYLGISSLDSDATATFVAEGKIVYAAQEERFTRKKQQDGFPFKAVESGLNYLKIGMKDVASIGYGWFTPEEERRLYLEYGASSWSELLDHRLPVVPSLRHILNVQRRGRWVNYKNARMYNDQLMEGLQKLDYKKPLKRYHHQQAHAASTFYTSGFDKALLLSLDGHGSGAVGSLYIGEGTQLRLIRNIPNPQSLGVMYGRVTKALGFIPNRHEGKVLGLAAYGNPDLYFGEIMKDFRLTEDGYLYFNAIDPFKYKSLFQSGKPADLAAAFQKVLETVVVHTARTYLRKCNLDKVCMSGGVAANVKMNQRIMELPECREIFVHPGMTDCGIGTGVAFLMASEHQPLKPYRLPDVFLGPEFSENDIVTALKKFPFKHYHEAEPEKKVAELLAKGHVVGRFSGRMEYGPRALCNRSILAPAQDAKINDWLNKRLNRTEFMPFAPVTLDTEADNMYVNMNKIRYTSEFMTITTDCSEFMKKHSPAAVHVDGTARPQIVTPASNPSMHKILTHYHRLTGVPTVINTSYNMHEEPIICSPYDGLKAFQDGRLDYLSLGDYILKAPQAA